jgi:hypothetical protein
VITIAMQGLKDPNEIVPTIRDLGYRHAEYASETSITIPPALL